MPRNDAALRAITVLHTAISDLDDAIEIAGRGWQSCACEVARRLQVSVLVVRDVLNAIVDREQDHARYAASVEEAIKVAEEGLTK